jgi:hypothetical protein
VRGVGSGNSAGDGWSIGSGFSGDSAGGCKLTEQFWPFTCGTYYHYRLLWATHVVNYKGGIFE